MLQTTKFELYRLSLKKESRMFRNTQLQLYGVKFFTNKNAFLVNYKICGDGEWLVL